MTGIARDERTFVLDRFVIAAHHLPTVRRVIAEEYLPLATRHGWQLEYQLLTPPVELRDGVNEVLILWSAPDPGAFWGAYALATMDDPAVRFLWAGLDEMLEARTRQCLTSWPAP